MKGEDKDAWKYYLKKNKIDLALAACNTPKLRAQCNGLWAESLLQRGNYTQAAKFFAKSNFSFEAVAMKFLKFNQINGLQDYLKNVLQVYKKSKLGKNDTQRKVLVTWLVEIEMTKINEFKASNPSNLTKPLQEVGEAEMI